MATRKAVRRPKDLQMPGEHGPSAMCCPQGSVDPNGPCTWVDVWLYNAADIDRLLDWLVRAQLWIKNQRPKTPKAAAKKAHGEIALPRAAVVLDAIARASQKKGGET